MWPNLDFKLTQTYFFPCYVGLGVLLYADTIDRHRSKQPVDTDPLEVNANPIQLETAATSPPQNIMAR